MKNKLEKSKFVKNFLNFQHAQEIEAINIEIERKHVLKTETHNRKYQASRKLGKKNLKISLYLDGEPINEPRSFVSSLDEIIENIIQLINVHDLTNIDEILSNDNDWEYIFSILAREIPSESENIEHLAAFVDSIGKLGLISGEDISKCADLHFSKERINKFQEKIIKVDIDKGSLRYQNIKNKKIKPDFLSKKSSAVFLNSLNDAVPLYKHDIDNFSAICNRILSNYLIKEISRKYKHYQYKQSGIYNEGAFLETIANQKERLERSLPDYELIPKLEGFYYDKNQDSTDRNSEKKIKIKIDNSYEFFSEITNYYKTKRAPKRFEYINKLTPNVIYIEDSIGMGKTTLCKKIFLNLAKFYLEGKDPIPLFIEGRNIHERAFQGLLGEEYSIDFKFLDAVRSSSKKNRRKMILIIDAIDEIKNHEIQHSIIEECEKLIQDNIYIILSSRPVGNLKSKIIKTLKDPNIFSLNYEMRDIQDGKIPYFLKNYESVIFDYVFQESHIVSKIKSPIFFNIMINYIEHLEENDSSIKIPISLSQIILDYYQSLLDFSKEQGKINDSITLQDIIKYGSNISVKLFKNQIKSSETFEIDQLKSIGLILENKKDFNFVHKLFEYDFLARAIAMGNQELRNQDLFDIVSLCEYEGFKTGEHALKMVIDREDDVTELYLKINNSYFDIFENLYDDHDESFSRLKGMVSQARGKGITPYFRYKHSRYIEDLNDTESFNFMNNQNDFDIVQDMKFVNFLIETNDVNRLELLKLESEQIHELISIFKEESKSIMDSDSMGSQEWPISYLRRNTFLSIFQCLEPLKLLIEISPYKILKSEQITLLKLFYPDEFEGFVNDLISINLHQSKEHFWAFLSQLTANFPMFNDVEFNLIKDKNKFVGFILENRNIMECKNFNRTHILDLSLFQPNILKNKILWPEQFIQKIFSLIHEELGTDKFLDIIIEFTWENILRDYLKSLIDKDEDSLIDLYNRIHDKSFSRSRCEYYYTMNPKIIEMCLKRIKLPEYLEMAIISHINNYILKEDQKTADKLLMIYSKNLKKRYQTNPDELFTKTYHSLFYPKIWFDKSDLIEMDLLKYHQISHQNIIFEKSALEYIFLEYLKKLRDQKDFHEFTYFMNKIRHTFNCKNEYPTPLYIFYEFMSEYSLDLNKFIENMIDSKNPLDELSDLIDGKLYPVSFIDSFFEIFIKEMADSEEKQDKIFEYYMYFSRLKIPIKFEEKFLNSTKCSLNLLNKKIKIPNPTPRLEYLLEKIAIKYPDKFCHSLLNHLDFMQDSFWLSVIFENYSQFNKYLKSEHIKWMIEMISRGSNEIEINLSFVNDLFEYLLTNSHMLASRVFERIFEQKGEKFLYILRRYEKNEQFSYALWKFLKHKPIYYLDSIENSQEEAIKWLESNDVKIRK